MAEKIRNYAKNIMLQGGWARPIGTKDWHYFKQAILKSVCGRFEIDQASSVVPGSDGDTHNCQECRTALLRGD